MFPNSQQLRHPAQTLALSGQYLPPAYDFCGYQHADASSAPWNPIYASLEEFSYGFTGSSPSAGQVSYVSPDVGHAPPASGAGGSLPSYNLLSAQDLFSSRRRQPESTRQTFSVGKTRTKDKYRVVYTDHQRLELEKEFQSNRYITMRRKSDLSMTLGLSERQVKIWFQNRRAKERKINRKKLQHSQQASTTTPTPPVLSALTEAHVTSSPGASGNMLSDIKTEEY